MFGTGQAAPRPDHTFQMKFEKIPGHKKDFNHWTINGKSFPDIEKLRLEKASATGWCSTTIAATFIRCICIVTPSKSRKWEQAHGRPDEGCDQR